MSPIEETSSWHDDLITLKNMVLNSSPDMREDAGSDLVVLFVDGNYKDCTIVGNAFQQAPIGRPDFGFAIVEGDGANKYTFAHEVAHTLGCRHTWDQTQLPEYATGYYWKYDGRKRATIMAPANKTRILHFSNPDVEFDGHVTGFEDFQNNARKLRESNDSIADNFCFEPAMLAWISGPHKGHEDTIYTWCANALYCDEIDIYHWEISTDGITFSTYANNSSASCISIYLPTDYDLFIRLTVTCLDDQEVTTFSHIFNLDNEFIDPLVIFYTDVSSYEGSTIETLTVSPNPALGELTISFDLSKSAKVSIYRIDILGQSKLISQDYFDKGLNRIKDNNTVDLNGPYYYTLISDDETKTKKVIFK